MSPLYAIETEYANKQYESSQVKGRTWLLCGVLRGPFAGIAVDINKRYLN